MSNGRPPAEREMDALWREVRETRAELSVLAEMAEKLGRVEGDLLHLSRGALASSQSLSAHLERLGDRVRALELEIAGADRRVTETVDRSLKRFVFYLSIPVAVAQIALWFAERVLIPSGLLRIAP